MKQSTGLEIGEFEKSFERVQAKDLASKYATEITYRRVSTEAGSIVTRTAVIPEDVQRLMDPQHLEIVAKYNDVVDEPLPTPRIHTMSESSVNLL